MRDEERKIVGVIIGLFILVYNIIFYEMRNVGEGLNYRGKIMF